MRIIKLKDKYKVESSQKGVFYDVFPDKPFCSCPAFKFRRDCKHLNAVREETSVKSKKDYDKILEEVLKKGEIDSIVLIEKYGQDAIEDLIHMGELIEEKGKIKLLR